MRQQRILLVEDDPDDRLLLSHLIRIVMDYDLTFAYDGEHAIELTRSEQFDLVVLDLKLPRLSGWEVADALREMEGYHDVPIIALTAYDVDGLPGHSPQENVNAILRKPIEINPFMETVTSQLGIEGSRV